MSRNKKVIAKFIVLFLNIIVLLVLISCVDNTKLADNTPKIRIPVYKVTKVYPTVKTKKVSDHINVKISRINDLNNDSRMPRAILMNNDQVLIKNKGLELYNPILNKFIILKALFFQADFLYQYDKNKYLIGNYLIYDSKTNKLSEFNLIDRYFIDSKIKELQKEMKLISLPDRFYDFISPDKKMYTIGCFDKSNCCKGFYIYDRKNYKLSKNINFKKERDSFEPLILKNGKILIIGGLVNKTRNGEYRYTALKSIELYDPFTGKIFLIGNMLRPRAVTKSVELPNRKILITGGITEFKPHETIPDLTGEIFDLNTGKSYMVKNVFKSDFSELQPGVNRNLNKIIYAGSGIVILSSSFNNLYDAKTNMFYTLDHLAIPRNYHQLVLLNNGKVLVIGGEPILEKMDSYNFTVYYKYCNLAYQKAGREEVKSICDEVSKSAELIEIYVKGE